jgi:XTP/dITP diphosphohydrolase
VKLVLASSNSGKLVEIRKLLVGSKYEIVNQSEMSVADAIEDGSSFHANALIKARHANAQTGLASISDDSGLEVDYLHGKPGIRSARYAGENASDQDNIAKLLDALSGVPLGQRTARFHCVMALVSAENTTPPVYCHGIWEGLIAEQASGENGFGYDPVFFVPRLNCTSAMLSPEIKNLHSHRAKALQILKQHLV